MCFSRILSPNQLRQCLLSRFRLYLVSPTSLSSRESMFKETHRLLNRLFQSLIETCRVWHGPRPAHCSPEISQIVHRHPAHDDQHALVPQRRNRLTELVMLIRILAIVQADLHNRYLQWILLRIERHHEGREDAVIHPSTHPARLQTRRLDPRNHALGQRFASNAGVLEVIVVCWEAVEAVFCNSAYNPRH